MFVDEGDKVAMVAIPYLSVLIKHIEKVNLPNDEGVLMQPTNAVRSHVRTAADQLRQQINQAVRTLARTRAGIPDLDTLRARAKGGVA